MHELLKEQTHDEKETRILAIIIIPDSTIEINKYEFHYQIITV